MRGLEWGPVHETHRSKPPELLYAALAHVVEVSGILFRDPCAAVATSPTSSIPTWPTSNPKRPDTARHNAFLCSFGPERARQPGHVAHEAGADAGAPHRQSHGGVQQHGWASFDRHGQGAHDKRSRAADDPRHPAAGMGPSPRHALDVMLHACLLTPSRIRSCELS